MNTVTENELARLAGAGDTKVLTGLLDLGGDPDASNSEGVPLLRIAALTGHVDTAACLLHYGADYSARDSNGLAVLSPDVIGLETLHRIRQHYHRFRTDRRTTAQALTSREAQWKQGLDERGVVKLDGLLDNADLHQMQQDFSAFVTRLNAKILRKEGLFGRYDEEEHFWPRDRAYVTNNAFKYSAALVRLCARPELQTVIRSYIGKPPQLTRAVAMRYLPDREKDRDMFGWHHDLEDQRVKLLVLLTDVGPDDQYMSYVCGSHRLKHPYEMFLDNQCPLDYCREQLGALEVFTTVGRAGDCFLFDSNGAHRGNRRPGGAIRDTWFVEFSADRSDVWGGDIPEGALDGLEFRDANPFQSFLAAEKKWDRPITRKSPTWVENLPDVDSWVGGALELP